ncbi:hypothetical protein CU097_007677, partial [Rhizopus azygosporus]
MRQPSQHGYRYFAYRKEKKYQLLVRIVRKFQCTQPNTSLFSNTRIPSIRVSSHSITKETTRAVAKASRLHGKCNYVTANCKLAKELEVSDANTHGKESFSKLCYKCNASYISDQNKVCLKRRSAFQRNEASDSPDASTGALKHSPASAAAYDDKIDGEIDEILEYDDLVKDTQRYSSLCNYQPFNKKIHAFLNKRTDSFFVPITIGRALTGPLVDTGCNLSTISPDLANFLKIKTPHMQLASLNTLCSR